MDRRGFIKAIPFVAALSVAVKAIAKNEKPLGGKDISYLQDVPLYLHTKFITREEFIEMYPKKGEVIKIPPVDIVQTIK